MEITSIPTDKFYKFLTIGGIVIIITSITYLFLIQRTKERKNVLIESAILNASTYFLQKDIDEILRKYPEINKEDDHEGMTLELVPNANYLSKNSSEDYYIFKYEYFRTDSIYLDSIVRELNKISQKRTLADVEATICDNYIVSTAHDTQIAQILLYSSSVIGFLLCLWGFRMWYRLEVKVQKKNRNR